MMTPQHLRMARAGLGWTLNDLAQRAGVNPNTISRYEVGREVLSGTLHKVEDALRQAGVILVDDESGIGIILSAAKPKKGPSPTRRAS